MDAECTDSNRNSVDVQCRLQTTQERNHWLQENRVNAKQWDVKPVD